MHLGEKNAGPSGKKVELGSSFAAMWRHPARCCRGQSRACCLCISGVDQWRETTNQTAQLSLPFSNNLRARMSTEPMIIFTHCQTTTLTTLAMKGSIRERMWHIANGRCPNISLYIYSDHSFVYTCTSWREWSSYFKATGGGTFKTQTKTSNQFNLPLSRLGQRLVAWMTSSSNLNLYEAVKTWIQLLCQHASGTYTCSFTGKVI